MEVLVALTVFLIALIGLGRLAIMGSDRALETQSQNRATMLCQSKMAEVLVGAVPLNSQSDVPFDEDPDWTWSLDCEQGNVSGLWNVTLTVKHESAAGLKTQCVMSQMLLDPSLRGSTMDAAAAAAAASNSNTSTGGTDPNSQNNNQSQQQSPQAQQGQQQQSQVKGGVTPQQQPKQQQAPQQSRPQVSQPQNKQPTTKQPTTKQPTTKQPTTKQPTGKGP
jgi:Tfp pilus assembly protein PilV